MSPHPSLYVKRGPEYTVLLANPPLCMIITHVRLSCFDSPIKTEINTVYKINTKIHECLESMEFIRLVSRRYHSRSLRSLVRYLSQHSK